MISSKRDSCSQLVAGNYDVIVDDHLDMTPVRGRPGEEEEEPDERKAGEPDKMSDSVNNDNKNLKKALKSFLERHHQYELELEKEPSNCSYVHEFKLLKEFSKSLKEDKGNLVEGRLLCNIKKNRYGDIIPFNHTRVILNSEPGVPGSDYINASYIKGQSGNQSAYIASQGPLESTLGDFWRMIWECDVSIIVMACNERESGELKCELYWPQQVESSRCYGNIRVHLVRVRQICSDFLIRKFSIDLLEPSNSAREPPKKLAGEAQAADQPANSNGLSKADQQNNNYFTDTGQLDHNQNKHGESPQRRVLARRTICQFHYTTWPDHGAPDQVQPILDMVRLFREVQPAENKPILVHCSAGCGRTGTICCIDYVWGLLKSNMLDESLNLCNIISEMRQQRMSMVQTLEQYILCHRAVAALFIKYLNDLEPVGLIESLAQCRSKGPPQYEQADSTGGSAGSEAAPDEGDFGPVFI